VTNPTLFEHDCLPDSMVRFARVRCVWVILETRGYDPLRATKLRVAEGGTAAVNAAGRVGGWWYALATAIDKIPRLLPDARVGAWPGPAADLGTR
jgi:hypothetical protein